MAERRCGVSNADVVRNNMRKFLESKVHRNILVILSRVADRIILDIENGVIPVDTGNLQDSTGIGIYHGDILKRLVPRQTADVSRSDIYPAGLTNRDNVWGHNILHEAINKGAWKYSTGYSLVVFSAMPYAELVDIRTGYFEQISSEISPLVMQILRQVNPL